MTSANTKGYKEINSLAELHYEFGRATLLFSGKETDGNWELRAVFLKKVTTVLLSKKAVDWAKDLDKELQDNLSTIMLSIHSNRTAVATVALSFVNAIASSVGSSLSIYTLEIMMNNLLKISSTTKKGLATQAFKAANNLLSNISFHTKIMAMLCKTVQERNPQLREFSASYIQTVLDTHASCQIVKSRVANEDLNQPIQKFIQKGLTDAAPTVREACKKLFSVYNKHWPTEGEYLCQQLDPSLQRRLGVKLSSSYSTKSTKPLFHRVEKSTNGIQKPRSRLAITKANSSMIKNVIASTAIQLTKPDSPLSSGKVAITKANSSMIKKSIASTAAQSRKSKSLSPTITTANKVQPNITDKSKKTAINRTVKSTSSIQKPSSRSSITKARLSKINSTAAAPIVRQTKSSMLLALTNKSKTKNL